MNINNEQNHSIKYDGTYGELFKLWFKSLLLMICTLGIYVFWAYVNIKKYVYQHTSINNYFFDFHAKGKQYFIGFLAAIGVLVFFLVIVALSIKLGILYLPFCFVLILYGLIPWLIVKNYRFEARLTSLNNVPFDFKGSVKRAYLILFGYPSILILLMMVVPYVSVRFINILPSAIPLNLVILGLFLFFSVLWVFALLSFILSWVSYFINGFSLGQWSFQICGLQKRKILLAIFIGFVIYCFPVFLLVSMDSYGISESSVILFVVSFFIIILLVFVYVFVSLRNYFFSKTTINGLPLRSTYRVFPYLFLIITNFLIILFSLGLLIPIAITRTVTYFADNTHVDGDFVLERGKEEISSRTISPEALIDVLSSL